MSSSFPATQRIRRSTCGRGRERGELWGELWGVRDPIAHAHPPQHLVFGRRQTEGARLRVDESLPFFLVSEALARLLE